MLADHAFDFLTNQGNRISIVETLEAPFKVMCLLEEQAARASLCCCSLWRERVGSSLLFWGLCEVQGLPNTPAALHGFQPLVNNTHCVRERFADVAFPAAVPCKIVSSLFCIWLFTKSLSLMHGLSLSSPSHSIVLIVNYACVITVWNVHLLSEMTCCTGLLPSYLVF